MLMHFSAASLTRGILSPLYHLPLLHNGDFAVFGRRPRALPFGFLQALKSLTKLFIPMLLLRYFPFILLLY